MTTINKYNLKFEDTYPYFIKHIKCDRKLSETVLQKVNFKEGYFFTFLPSYAFKDKLYHFSSGILPSFPTETKTVWQVVSKGWKIEEFIHNYLIQDIKNISVMDQYIAEYSDFMVEGVDVVFYQNEVHYIIKSDAPLKSIYNAVKDADHGWHLLVILTQDLNLTKKTFEEIDFDIICHNLKYIITTCYDGEGYLFWEKSQIKR